MCSKFFLNIGITFHLKTNLFVSVLQSKLDNSLVSAGVPGPIKNKNYSIRKLCCCTKKTRTFLQFDVSKAFDTRNYSKIPKRMKNF